jgi:hypothetical protein
VRDLHRDRPLQRFVLETAITHTKAIAARVHDRKVNLLAHTQVVHTPAFR